MKIYVEILIFFESDNKNPTLNEKKTPEIDGHAENSPHDRVAIDHWILANYSTGD